VKRFQPSSFFKLSAAINRAIMSDETTSDRTVSAPANNPRHVLLRDLVLFQMKLWLDGLKDIVLSPLSIAACVLDLVFRRSGQRSLFYSVMRLGERFDLWLNLYGPATRAGAHPDGLLVQNAIRGPDMVDAETRRSALPTPSQPSSSSSQANPHLPTPRKTR
jgi:hypothetical protein